MEVSQCQQISQIKIKEETNKLIINPCEFN